MVWKISRGVAEMIISEISNYLELKWPSPTIILRLSQMSRLVGDDDDDDDSNNNNIEVLLGAIIHRPDAHQIYKPVYCTLSANHRSASFCLSQVCILNQTYIWQFAILPQLNTAFYNLYIHAYNTALITLTGPPSRRVVLCVPIFHCHPREIK